MVRFLLHVLCAVSADNIGRRTHHLISTLALSPGFSAVLCQVICLIGHQLYTYHQEGVAY